MPRFLLAAVCAALLSLTPHVTLAEGEATAKGKTCSESSGGASKASAGGVEKDAKKAVQQMDKTSTDTVTVGKDGKVTVASQCNPKCIGDKLKDAQGKPSTRACPFGTVTMNLPTGQTVTCSKAEKGCGKTVEAVQGSKEVIAAAESDDSDALSKSIAKTLAANPAIQTALEKRMQGAIDEAFKASSEGAGALAAAAKEGAEKTLAAIANGDFDGAVGVAKGLDDTTKGVLKSLGINPDIQDPTQAVKAFGPEAAKAMGMAQGLGGTICSALGGACPEGMRQFAGGSTFGSEKDSAAKGGVGGLDEVTTAFVDQLRGGGCRGGELSCRTNNPGAMRYSSWMQKFGGVSCGQPNDTACFPSIEAGLAAKADLIIRRVESGCNTLYSLLENCRYSSSRDGNNSALYARVVGQKTGLGASGLLDPKNADQMARLVSGIAWYEQGQKGYGFNADQLTRALSVAYGKSGVDSLPKGTPGFQGGVSGFGGAFGNMPGSNASPFAAIGGAGGSLFSGLLSGGSGGSSPLGMLGNLFGLGGGSGGSGGGSSGGGAAGGATPPRAVQPPTVTAPRPTVPAPTSGTTATAQAPDPVMTLSVPQSVKRGGTFAISWAALNVQSSTCVVKEGTVERGRGSLGSYTATAPTDISVTSVKFTFSCFSLNTKSTRVEERVKTVSLTE